MVTTGMEMAMASGRFLKEEPKTESETRARLELSGFKEEVLSSVC